MNWSKVEQALTEASVQYRQGMDSSQIQNGFVFPGAVLAVSRGGEMLHHKAYGCRSLLPTVSPLSEDIVFDLASLTKALVTTTLVMQLVERGQLSLDRKVAQLFQTFGSHGRESMTLRHLLSHSSGYPDYLPFYRKVVSADSGERTGIMTSRGAVEMIYREIFQTKLENLPGKVSKYSDIGFILLGHVIEVATGGSSIERLAIRDIFKPLELRSTGFIDLSKVKRRGLEPVTDVIAPTARCPWRGRVLCGEVHDDNAWVMGGIAGHAGLFGTAVDVQKVAQTLLDCYHGRSSFIDRDVVKTFWSREVSVPNGTWALGWDTPSAERSSAGKYFSKDSVGHLGFTGCSLWIDPSEELVVVLLTNRIHPSTENKEIKQFRPMLHDLVREAVSS